MEYEGFELDWAEEIIKRFAEQAKGLSKESPESTVKDATEVERVLSARWSPRRLESETFPKIEVSTGRASALVIVLPPRHRLLATEAAKDVSSCLEWAEKAKGYPVVIYYSRKGLMTTAAYLYLGNLMEDTRVGVLFVNGPPSEVSEVLDILERKGEYSPDEEQGVISLDF